jgi:hypothetical protein
LGIFEDNRITRLRRTATAGAISEASAMVSLAMLGLFIALFSFSCFGLSLISRH